MYFINSLLCSESKEFGGLCELVVQLSVRLRFLTFSSMLSIIILFMLQYKMTIFNMRHLNWLFVIFTYLALNWDIFSHQSCHRTIHWDLHFLRIDGSLTFSLMFLIIKLVMFQCKMTILYWSHLNWLFVIFTYLALNWDYFSHQSCHRTIHSYTEIYIFWELTDLLHFLRCF